MVQIETILKKSIANLPAANEDMRAQAVGRQAQLTKPSGSLGRLEDIATFMAAWQGTIMPVLNHPQCLIFAGNHGITQKGISLFPAEVTAQMVINFEQGGAAINQLCNEAGLKLDVIPLELDRPTADFCEGLAMSRDEVIASMQAGADAIDEQTNYLALGEMGIGNTTSAAAIATILFGGDALSWTGAGTGLDQAGIIKKAAVIEQAIALHGREFSDPVDLLSAVGGRELCAIAGAILAARERSITIMLDGFICCAAAACLTLISDNILDHCLISHQSAETAHAKLCEKLGIKPLLHLDMRLGEGSGAALASLIVKAALATHNQMATFAQAGVSDSE